jgi:FtsP/CotA-like multicopper oxidase with cupredoxin domain
MRLLRRLLYLLLTLGILAAAGIAALFFLVLAPVSTVGQVDFDQELAVPPLAPSRVTDDGTRVFDLTAGEGTAELLPGKPATTWGFNGAYLGPTLRAERGERVRVNVHNHLDETTTVHWHGMHLPARFDGGPHQPIGPGETWSPHWRIDQPAATLWYHPHPHGRTEDHVNRGLAGMFLLDDPGSEVAAKLPHEYGVDDIPLTVQDKRLDGNGQIQSGGLGEDVLVNGTYGPHLDVTTQRVRLRLLNASVKRVFAFGFSDDRAFTMVGSDGGLLPAPARLHRVQLSPGERAEIVVTMRPGENVVLRSFQPDLGAGYLVERFEGGQDELDVLQLRAAERLRPSPPVPDRLAPAPHLDDDLDGAAVRTFRLQGRRINGASMDMARVDEVVHLGTTEVWEVTNTDGEYHNFHVHDVRFQVLSVDGHEPGPPLSGWKDTVYLAPGRTVRLAVRFTDYADPDSPYMYHCHLLQHEDSGMMGQFVVVTLARARAGAPAPARTPARPRSRRPSCPGHGPAAGPPSLGWPRACPGSRT